MTSTSVSSPRRLPCPDVFVALSIHVQTLAGQRNSVLRSIARSIFLGYVVALGIGVLEIVPQSPFALGAELSRSCCSRRCPSPRQHVRDCGLRVSVLTAA
jgi:hypothetical protein